MNAKGGYGLPMFVVFDDHRYVDEAIAVNNVIKKKNWSRMQKSFVGG